MLTPTGQPALDRRRFLFGCAAASLSGCTAAIARPRGAEHTVEFTVVIRGGRVVDPGQGVDMSVDLAIEDTRVAAIGPNLRGRIILDAEGCVVAPGFVDLHSHAQTVSAHRLQAFDGVTTTLELEAGAIPVAAAYARASAEGRPLNYGYSASWAGARIQVLTGDRGREQTMLARFADPAWQREATAAEEDRIIGMLETEVAAGALGIGVLVGYAPGTSLGEYLRVARLAAVHRVPTYTHARDLTEVNPDTRMDGAEELVRAAAETGAHMHFCHVNSSSGRHVDRVLALVDRSRREGAVVTTEAYPYGAGMTMIGAVFLAPERLAARGLQPTDIVYARTNERVRDAAHLSRLRAADPGGPCIVHFLDETKATDTAVLRASLFHEDTMVASDAIPMVGLGPGTDWAWPLPPSARTHPRTAGTFARSFRRLVGEGKMSVLEFIQRASLLPARVIGTAVGSAPRKGTLAVGADADVVVFDPDAFRDRATYEASTQPSAGVRHLLVGGEPVIRDGTLALYARPGRPVRRF
jgi:imidazolonepropionase-like amidohydrolase